MSALKGVWVPVLTPQNSDLLIDKNRFFHHLDWLFQYEINGVVLFGTNGEANSFSVQERMLLLEWVKKEGISNEKVIVGTGCSALTDTIALIEHARLQCSPRISAARRAQASTRSGSSRAISAHSYDSGHSCFGTSAIGACPGTTRHRDSGTYGPGDSHGTYNIYTAEYGGGSCAIGALGWG